MAVPLSWAVCVNLQTRNVATNDWELKQFWAKVSHLFFPPTAPTTCPLTLSPSLSSHLLLSSAPTSSPSLLWVPHLVKPQMAGQHGATRVICLAFQRGEGQGRSRDSQDDGHVLGDHQPWGQAGWPSQVYLRPSNLFPLLLPSCHWLSSSGDWTNCCTARHC